MYDQSTGKTITPSAGLWKTAQNRHVTRAVAEQACRDSQNESYRKATEQLRSVSGHESFLSTTTVWNLKQKTGKELQEQQDAFVEKVANKHGNEMIEHGLLPVLAAEKQEPLFTKTETSDEKPLSETEKEDVDELFFHFVPLETVSQRKHNGNVTKNPKPRKTQRKCHVEKRRKKAFERLIPSALWEGKVSQAVWMLWGVRGEAKTWKRIDDLMGYT